ncbi:potassium transporter 26-like [Phoenix dactylifera]|uniref:Potassium transporter n=1 Tax=Phoenix dactylifera TaxID=42345 RepID=A0A8B7CWU2_PHODC|nr:potassium transporter 26-like [Phoenix dactylifera]
MEEARGGEAIVDMDNGNPKEDGEQPRRTLGFGNAYMIPQRQPTNFTLMQTVLLSYQALGVVYGDIGTSPLYVFSSITLPNPGEKDILGILSLIFWTLTMMGLIKYVVIVLHADDHGEGGTFAIYSLLRQNIHFKGKMIMPSTRLDSDSNLRYYSRRSGLHSKAHKFLEKNSKAQILITIIVLLGTCMVIGDGALTPAISVLSAVQGIQSRSSKITQDDVVILSVVILLILFLFQRFGTSKVSFSFSPIMLLWFGFIASIGVYNIIKFYPPVLKALSPHYIYYYFARNHKKGWELLGAIALCITGAEAMFADMGHFSKHAIQLAFSTLVYPALILAYAGEAAFFIKNPDKISTTFYSSVPDPIFWPMFVVATLAAVVASQALISASFSIIRQSIVLGCFPRVTMTHTSDKYEGQVYSPEVNYFLMIASILITVGFKGGAEIGNAYGVAVIWVMLITTFLMAVVMLVIWETNILFVLLFVIVFVGIEGVYMTSLLHKVPQGGWVPFAISAFFLVITLSWTYGRSKKSEYEAIKKMDRVQFNQLVACSTRVPGICFFCTDLINGIPPIVRHYVQHVSSLREVMVFVTVRTLPVRSVLPEERFLVAKLDSEGVYRCLVQYGYMDKHNMEGEEYIASVVSALKEIVENAQESEMLDSALNSGAIFVLGRIILQVSERSGWWRHFIINNLYRFLQKNFRSNVATLRIPHDKILQVGMVYEI